MASDEERLLDQILLADGSDPRWVAQMSLCRKRIAVRNVRGEISSTEAIRLINANCPEKIVMTSEDNSTGLFEGIAGGFFSIITGAVGQTFKGAAQALGVTPTTLVLGGLVVLLVVTSGGGKGK
jgi:hypothetical protein